MLSSKDDITVVAVPLNGHADLCQAIELVHPDVVIMDEDLLNAHHIELLKLLRGFHELRLVVFNAGDNHIQIYDKREILVRQLSDFFNAIEWTPFQ